MKITSGVEAACVVKFAARRCTDHLNEVACLLFSLRSVWTLLRPLYLSEHVGERAEANERQKDACKDNEQGN
jgi:hypothetical protein